MQGVRRPIVLVAFQSVPYRVCVGDIIELEKQITFTQLALQTFRRVSTLHLFTKFIRPLE